MAALRCALRPGSLMRAWTVALLGLASTSAVALPAVEPPEGSPVAVHGRLSTNGSSLLDEHGRPVQLRGMSFFWECWMGKYWNGDVVAWLARDWNASLVRLAMGVDPQWGYLDKPDEQKATLEAVVNAAIEAGIYAIIDWHTDKAPEHTDNATAFFDEMARLYGDYPNILFESFNEPTTQNWTTEVKPYHEKIVSTIRKHSKNLVILGTTTWSQDVDIASQDPVAGENLAYTLHFYAATHKEALRKKAEVALARNLTLFSTEWGTCGASGNGTLDLAEARTWLDFLTARSISVANWAVSDKYESCSALRGGASTSGAWSVRDLTQSGYFVRNWLRGEDAGVPCFATGWPCVEEKTSCAGDSAGCKEEKCCAAEGQTCFEKDGGWAQCMESCTPGVHDSDPPKYQTPWTCDVVGPSPAPSPPAEPFFTKVDKLVLAWAGVSSVWAVSATICCLVAGRGGSRAYGPLLGGSA